MDVAAIKMCEYRTRKARQGFRQCDSNVGKQVQVPNLERAMRLLMKLKDDGCRLGVGKLIALTLKHYALLIITTTRDIEAQLRFGTNDTPASALLALILFSVFLALAVTIRTRSHCLRNKAISSMTLLKEPALATARNTVFLHSTWLAACSVTMRANDILFQREMRCLAIV